MSYNTIKYDVNGNIATITINRPDQLNALNDEVVTDLKNAVEEVKENPDLRALIITGEGRAFVAGADIKSMNNLDQNGGRKLASKGHGVFRSLENLDIPVIAAVNGFALGGGCELAMSCDIRIASDKAVFGLPEVGLGIIPGYGGTQRLQRLVGQGFAKYLVFTAENIDANKALEIGLVQEVVEADQLISRCEEIAKRISQNGPLAVSLAKKAIDAGAQTDLDTAIKIEENAFVLAFGSEDKEIGTNAFVNKQRPEFKNR